MDLEKFDIPNSFTSKADHYTLLLSQMTALVEGEINLVANLSNITAVLKTGFNFFWVGFYIVEGDEMVLGPFQGPVACSRIKKGKGVCGTSWEQDAIFNVPNVNEFEGHIACSTESKSEIVLPIHDASRNVTMVLDIDSSSFDTFDEEDERGLADVVTLIESIISA